MGFLNGRVTFVRYKVSGDSPLPFGEDHLEAVRRLSIDRRGGTEAQDGVSFGWAGGDHVLDLSFDPLKNLIHDAMHLALRIDTDKIPGDLLRAYTKIETEARAQLNPSGRPTKAQKEEAKEAAKARAEAEAADGRFRRMKHYPILWDGQSGLLYAGMTSASALDRLHVLFKETFDRTLEPLTAGRLADDQAIARGEADDSEQSAKLGLFGEDDGIQAVAWSSADGSSRELWGNEFLIWLWHTLQADGDTIQLADGSEATVMLAKTLMLDCPRGETGRDNLTNEGPARMPEAIRALQAGKLPRKAGLILVRHGMQYEMTLQAESLAVSGAALPKIEEASGHDAKVARVDSLRHLVESLDLLFDAFGSRRGGSTWTAELGRIRDWLSAA
ncbi:MAG: hypothetical protein U0800_18305 [Isosphaeraceae bacterium]